MRWTRFFGFVLLAGGSLLAYYVVLGQLLQTLSGEEITYYGTGLPFKILHFVVPALIVLLLTFLFGIWKRQVNVAYKVVSVLLVFILPLALTLFEFYFGCVFLHGCI